MGAGQQNLQGLCKLKEQQQALLRHGRPQLPDVQGRRKPDIDFFIFLEDELHVDVRGPRD